MTSKIPPKTKGLTRLVKALFYSIDGLKSAYHTEEAFRQEVWVLIPVMVGLWGFLPFSLGVKLGLSGAALLLILIELVNTAIERLVDLASPDYHQLAKEAKDIGSAVVLLSLTFNLFLWALALWHYQDLILG
ncbi:MAG: hypothetical protein A2508_09490 [Candidatus Lambdaproteobacteria bacterium RIFOXYD12_FULL_49_8]|uniref:Diacylglycerol kinase n=1 Tax=Candidatus Lambdaproteobacteria bacterium RIFOXYD2_FULL_50_16 TaxID=1817772 RepID=A0A1F6GAA0_9PROT|nr:MAG: hypothetical protein A2527_12480 [Candidatus Lambdaproteobacteria bacterium RIFOXYD2_FULL_50_16]OGG97360.1 MAG: hypothetical protein A2508_09490 [Candidatus Lambdaproteobacteria bacterium RIFOXYD12_FULL_49_8]